jgi:hypothetical protein
MPRRRFIQEGDLVKKLVLALAGLAAALVLTVVALADGGGEKSLRSSLAPSVPADPAFHGVTPGGVPWVLTRGDVRIKEDGQFDLEVIGLVIPALGNADGVTTISASLFCGADANAAPAVTTGRVPLSSEGDARISERVALPATCLAPIVLVHPNGATARWIAATGWKP